jgi:hypothetical protein
MRVLPIHRLQSYFRELEIQEAARNTEPLPVYFGGPGELAGAYPGRRTRPHRLPSREQRQQPNNVVGRGRARGPAFVEVVNGTTI